MLVSNPNKNDIRGGRFNKILLIPELCRPVGLDDQQKKNFGLMKEIADRNRKTPAERIQCSINFVRRLNTDTKALEENQLGVEGKPIEFEGRKLTEQTIIFGKDQNNHQQVVCLSQSNDSTDWTQNLRDVKLYLPISLKKWVYIYPIKLEAKTNQFLSSFYTAGGNLGMEISRKARAVSLKNDYTSSYVEKIQEYIKNDAQFIMIILPNENHKRYGEIKTTCFRNGDPVPSQIVLQKTMEKNSLSVATKVAIQINCKLGGIPWSINMPIKGLLAVGFSLTKSMRDKKELFGAMVASMRSVSLCICVNLYFFFSSKP